MRLCMMTVSIFVGCTAYATATKSCYVWVQTFVYQGLEVIQIFFSFSSTLITFPLSFGTCQMSVS